MNRKILAILAAFAALVLMAGPASARGDRDARVVNDPDSTCAVLLVDDTGTVVGSLAPGEQADHVWGFAMQDGCTGVDQHGTVYGPVPFPFWYATEPNYRITTNPTPA